MLADKVKSREQENEQGKNEAWGDKRQEAMCLKTCVYIDDATVPVSYTDRTICSNQLSLALEAMAHPSATGTFENSYATSATLSQRAIYLVMAMRSPNRATIQIHQLRIAPSFPSAPAPSTYASPPCFTSTPNALTSSGERSSGQGGRP